ncbi:hypothetical protein BASA61_003541 [Batrachochytrium salamandrivorans]|nr:hypothetical protein BASA61_003541 [Batrachochytrium salamandrivorans]
MPISPLEKIPTESPRPQRRHYENLQACDRQNKLLKDDLERRTSNSTYQTDFIQSSTSNLIVDRICRRRTSLYDAPLAELQRLDKHISKYSKSGKLDHKQADRLLYMSTYQAAFTTQKQKLDISEFRYTNDKELQREQHAVCTEPPPTTLYHESYDSPKTGDIQTLGNPGKEHAMTKSLYLHLTPDLTVTDLLKGNGKSQKSTSYGRDYQGFENFKHQPQPQPSVLHHQGTPLPRAIKYRRWAQQ